MDRVAARWRDEVALPTHSLSLYNLDVFLMFCMIL
jgi:hypothetical protein